MTARRASEVPTATKVKQSAQSKRKLKDLCQQVPAAYTYDGTYRKERKVLDAGARVEEALEQLINTGRRNKLAVVCWRRPGVKARRLSGVNYFPDAAGYVPEIAHLVKDQVAQIKGRPVYNVLFEFKGQYTTGSAEKKIATAILDLAHHCDVAATVGAVILDTPALTDQQIIELKNQGEVNSVVVLTAEEVDAGALVPELIRVAGQRKRLQRRFGPRGGYTSTKRPDVAERALAYRHGMRQQMAKSMRKYGEAGLVR